MSDGTVSCAGTVAAGQCQITFTSTGTKSLSAAYAGDSNFNGSTSATASHQVNGASTTTTITSDNPDPSVVGQSVTVQYSVTSAVTGTPTGNVTVSDGTISCTGTVAAGQCSLTFTTAGARSLTAMYAGDSTYAGSTSAAAPHQVNKADTTTTITADNPDPSTVNQTVTVSYTVAVTTPGAGVPTGNVTVSDGTVSCTGTVAAKACNITFTTPGAKSLTATYVGDSNFNGSTSPAVSHTVIQITLSPASLPNGKVGVSYSQTITASGGTAPYAFSIISGTLPPGLTLSQGGVISGKPTTIGTYAFTVQAQDQNGVKGSRNYTITIIYNFTGFFSPVDNPPALNEVNAGNSQPLKFSLGGNLGLNILAANSPASQEINCQTKAPVGNATSTNPTGKNGLQYNTGTNQYQYNWKTDPAWKGTCRQFILTLNDGTPAHMAFFHFK